MNITNIHLARRYAIAFLRLYGNTIDSQAFLTIKNTYQFLQLHPEIMFFLSRPMISDEEQKICLKKLTQKFSLLPEFERLVELLIEHRRTYLFNDILRSLLWEYQIMFNTILFFVTSSHALSKVELDSIKNFLEKTSGALVIIEHTIDKSLIAGIKIISDMLCWEYSINRQLNRIESLTA